MKSSAVLWYRRRFLIEQSLSHPLGYKPLTLSSRTRRSEVGQIRVGRRAGRKNKWQSDRKTCRLAVGNGRPVGSSGARRIHRPALSGCVRLRLSFLNLARRHSSVCEVPCSQPGLLGRSQQYILAIRVEPHIPQPHPAHELLRPFKKSVPPKH